MKFNIFLIIFILVNVSSFPLRKLYSATDLLDFCKDVKYEHKTSDLPFSEYANQIVGNSNDTSEFLEHLLDYNSFQIVLLMKKLFFVLFHFCVIWNCFYILDYFYILLTFKCGLFKKRKSNRGVCFKIIVFGLFGILIAAGLTALGLSTSVDEDFDGFICSFDAFFEHTLKGEDQPSETSSKWIGLNNIETELNDTFIKMNAILNTLSNSTDKFHTNFNINSTKVHNLLNTEVETNIVIPQI